MEALFILRHGIAEELSENSTKSDFERKLTEEGIKKTKKLSCLFNRLKEEVHTVLTSPYLRAKETAEIFVNNLDKKPDLKVVDFLSAGTSVSEISKGLHNTFSENKSIMLVGHAPDLEFFLGKLIGGKNIKLKKGALAKVSLDKSSSLTGELEWLITPKIIKNSI